VNASLHWCLAYLWEENQASQVSGHDPHQRVHCVATCSTITVTRDGGRCPSSHCTSENLTEVDNNLVRLQAMALLLRKSLDVLDIRILKYNIARGSCFADEHGRGHSLCPLLA
jgi:hypothetical protein